MNALRDYLSALAQGHLPPCTYKQGMLCNPDTSTYWDKFTESLWLGLAGMIPLSPSRTSASNCYNLPDSCRALKLHLGSGCQCRSYIFNGQHHLNANSGPRAGFLGSWTRGQLQRVQELQGRQASLHADESGVWQRGPHRCSLHWTKSCWIAACTVVSSCWAWTTVFETNPKTHTLFPP